MIKIALIIAAIILALWVIKKFGKILAWLIALAVIAFIAIVLAGAFVGVVELPTEDQGTSLREQHEVVDEAATKVEKIIDIADAKTKELFNK